MSENTDVDSSVLPQTDQPEALFTEEELAAFREGQSQVPEENPVGTFNVRIISADFKRSQSSGRPQIAYKMEVLSGPGVGGFIFKYDGMGTPQQTQMTLQSLGKLGVNVKAISPTQIPAILAGLCDMVVQVFAKKNGDFYNVYFNRPIQAPLESADGACAAPTEEPPF